MVIRIRRPWPVNAFLFFSVKQFDLFLGNGPNVVGPEHP